MTNPLTSNEAFCKVFEEELEAVRVLLEAPERRVFVLGVVIDATGNRDDGFPVAMSRAASDNVTRNVACAYLISLQREIDRVEALLR